MRIALVSTWGSSCGIATYSEEYVLGLLEHKHEVIVLAPAEPGSCMRDVGYQVPVVQCWTRQSPMPRFEQVVTTAPGFDVIHFQHEHGLWRSDTMFIDVLNQIHRVSKARLVVTLHTVLPYGTWQRSGFYDALKAVADGIIVHTSEARANISISMGSRAKLATISHGTRLEDKGDREIGLRLLAVPEVYWDKAVFCLVFGFQGGSKNTIHTIRAFIEGVTHRYHDNGVLIVCGENCNDYYKELETTVAESGYGRRILLRPQFTAVKEVRHVLAAADFGVLNTTSMSLSASGACHVYARYGIPVAAAVRPIYMEAIRAGATPFWLHERDLYQPTLSSVNVIGAMVRDAGLRHDVGLSMRAFAEETSWDKIAKQHIEFYESLG